MFVSKKLYVGSLSYSTSDEGLKAHFSKAGNVESAMIITDKMSGRSKGFGFVEMSTDEEAQKAVEILNGQPLDGRNLIVNEARPQEARPRTGGFGGDRGGRGGDRGDRGGRGGFGGERRRF